MRANVDARAANNAGMEHEPPENLGEGTLELAPGVRVPASTVAWSFSRSGGPGGQNVNKVATRAELRVALEGIPIHPEARERLAGLAGSRLTAAGELVIVAQTERSQQANKAECLERLRELIIRAKVRPKKRVATKPTRGSQRRRMDSKKRRGDIKRGRQGGGDE
jgi:ribosome-associated protein